ncbi:MAG: class I SAM-dependent methyltransferase [Hyphomicrobiaceae bacterium]|nr:class I SAM-dependent methyltransferase [Hyphomicrobiaceae bacterium]
MPLENEFEQINEAKANMDGIYDQPDPRAYFRQLSKLDYAIPGEAKPVIQQLIRHLDNQSDGTVRILDVGCSYGINAALLKYDLTMPELYAHWSQALMDNAAAEAVIANDRGYFEHLHPAADIEVIGLDVAENALAYAADVGLLDEALAVNLEAEPLPTGAKQELAEVDLLLSTGCVGYVTERTFNRLLPAIDKGRRPWLANFVLRMFPFAPIENALAERGYVTEKLEGETFTQRRFASKDEQTHAMERLAQRGIDTRGLEADGQLIAEFYLSRPPEDVEAVPIERLLAA